jgi:hypothetical protein
VSETTKSETAFAQAMATMNPLPDEALRELPLDAAEAELARSILAEPRADGPIFGHMDTKSARRAGDAASAPRRHGRALPRFALGIAALAALAVALVAIGLGDGAGDRSVPAPAYAQHLVRLAKTSPLVLLDQPGWHVAAAKVGRDGHGSLRFRHEPATPDSAAEVAELRWRPGHLGADRRSGSGSGWRRLSLVTLGSAVRAPVTIYGFHGNRPRRIIAGWEDGGRVLEFSAVSTHLAHFKGLLNSLRRVGTGAWLDALPQRDTTR